MKYLGVYVYHFCFVFYPHFSVSVTKNYDANGDLIISHVAPSNSYQNQYSTSQRKKELIKYLTHDVLHKMENVKDNKGMTELHHAAKNGKENEVELLLYFLQDRNPKDDKGMSPIHYAAGTV